MQKRIQRWLFISVLVAFIFVAILFYFFQANHSQEYAEQLLKAKLSDVTKEIDTCNENVRDIKNITNKTALIKAHAFAELISKDPTILNTPEELATYATKLDVDELHVSNERGILIATYPESYIGFNMNSSEQSQEFMPAITDKNFELVQPVRKNASRNELFQYAGVARIDKPGIVQIGYNPKRLNDAINLADISNYRDTFRIGKTGFLQIARNNKYIVGSLPAPKIDPSNLPKNELFYITISGVEYFAYAKIYEENLLIALLPTHELSFQKWKDIGIFLCLCLIVFSIIYLITSWILRYFIFDDINNINKSLTKITAGELYRTPCSNRTKEIKELSDNINIMVNSLKCSHQDIVGKINDELNAAREIQLSAIPNKFPPFPDREEFQIFADVKIATSVGGDFYDFFMIDEDHLALIISDVSGKGVPAALFMTKTKTLIKEQLIAGVSLLKTIQRTNNVLAENNPQNMFATLFCAIVQISTGKVSCVNAGHIPPLIRFSTNNYKFLSVKRAIALGAIPNFHYVVEEFKMTPTSRLILYTDGITEALNSENQFFGMTNLRNLLTNLKPNIPINQIVALMEEKVDEFSEHKKYTDDIAILAFEYIGESADHYTLDLKANKENLPKLMEFISDKFSYIDKDMLNKIQIATEEIFVNICNYAYPSILKYNKNGRAFIEVEAAKNHIALSFLDTGIPYNPLENIDPDINQPAEERQIGGLGIFMVKQIMDLMEYQNRNGINILTMRKNLN